MDLDRNVTQEAFGALVGVTKEGIHRFVASGLLQPGGTAREWLLAYCGRLRAQAAGRDDSSLSAERARLAREQADRIAMKNAQVRRELVPATMLEFALASVSAQLARALEGLPARLRRRSSTLTPDDLAFVEDEIRRLRSAAAKIEIDWDGYDGLDGDPPRDTSGPESA